MDGTTPGWKTSEFWAKVLTVDIPMLIGAAHGAIPANIAAYVLLGSNVAYMLFRTWLKRGAVVANLKALIAGIKGGDISTLSTVVEKLTSEPVKVTTTTEVPA